MFWAIVGGVIVVVLALLWLYDRRHKIRSGGIESRFQDPNLAEVDAARYNRGLGGMGTGPGGGRL